jgi:hypothetical protein
LKLPQQLVCITLGKLPEVLFKLSLHLVPGAFDSAYANATVTDPEEYGRSGPIGTILIL